MPDPCSDSTEAYKEAEDVEGTRTQCLYREESPRSRNRTLTPGVARLRCKTWQSSRSPDLNMAGPLSDCRYRRIRPLPPSERSHGPADEVPSKPSRDVERGCT